MLRKERTTVVQGVLIRILQHNLEVVKLKLKKGVPDQGLQLKRENLVRQVPLRPHPLHQLTARNVDDHAPKQVYHCPQPMEKMILKFERIKTACKRNDNTEIIESPHRAAHWTRLHQEDRKCEDLIKVADLLAVVVLLEVVVEVAAAVAIDLDHRCVSDHVQGVDRGLA